MLAQQDMQVQQEGDPPSEVARVSVLLGNVSVEPASVDQFSAAEVNDPLTTGDRIYADVGANAELQTGLLAVRIGQQTDLTVTAMTDALEQFGLAQGSVHLRSFTLQQGTTVELDAPNVAVTVLQPGDVRVDVDPNAGITTVALISGQVEVDGNGFRQVLEAGQGLRLEGSNPVSAQPLDAVQPDGLDAFSNDRDAAYESAMQSEDAYVNPDTIGAEDLSSNGDWETDSDDGAVWYPTGVAVGWTPYSVGRWAWVAPWGWTWVDGYAWGFAPFHYGRWVHRGNRWGWVPGPPVVRPIYSPAMVAFVGRPGAAGHGGPVTAWFALGPHETYVPWYHASPLYMNRVNTASIHDANVAEVRSRYNQPTLASCLCFAGGAWVCESVAGDGGGGAGELCCGAAGGAVESAGERRDTGRCAGAASPTGNAGTDDGGGGSGTGCTGTCGSASAGIAGDRGCSSGWVYATGAGGGAARDVGSGGRWAWVECAGRKCVRTAGLPRGFAPALPPGRATAATAQLRAAAEGDPDERSGTSAGTATDGESAPEQAGGPAAAA